MITIATILSWSRYFVINKLAPENPDILEHTFQVKDELNNKVSLWKGDITKLKVDVIVNAANITLLGGGGVDGKIHYVAGPGLRHECQSLGGCKVGEAKLTRGHNLPANHVIHTVGTMTKNRKELEQCYKNSFALMLKHSFRSIAFPCISTGVYGYDKENAAHVAIFETRIFLNEHHEKVDRVIFCVHEDKDRKIYEELLQRYFPVIEGPKSVWTSEYFAKLQLKYPEKRELCDLMLQKVKPKQISLDELSKV